MHPHGYAAAQRQTLSGRALEREVFVRAAARLEAVDLRAPGGFTALAEALESNRALWRAVATDLASSSNDCPDDIKASLLSLASFVENHTTLVMRGEAGPNVLIEIDRNIAGGLAPAPAVAA